MDNKLIIFLSLAILLTAATIGTVGLSVQSDREVDDSSPSLNAKIEMKIKQDYLRLRTKPMHPDATVDDIMILKYYGSYSGRAAVLMTDSCAMYSAALETEVIDGITIQYFSSNKMLIWEPGNFISLKDAYNRGFLTKDDLMKISDVSFK